MPSYAEEIENVKSLPFLMAPLVMEDPNKLIKESPEYKEEFAKYYSERRQFTVLMPFDKSKYYPIDSEL